MNEIKTVNGYAIGDKIFSTKKEAMGHLRLLSHSRLLVISKHPDTMEGRYKFGNKVVYDVVVKDIKNIDNVIGFGTLLKIVENVVAKVYNKYTGMMGSLELVDNYKIEILEVDKLIEVQQSIKIHTNTTFEISENVIYLDEIPNDLSRAMDYIKDKLEIK